MAPAKLLHVAVPMLSLIGCATEYAPPPASVPAASLTLSTTSYGTVSIVGASAATCPSPVMSALAGFSFTLTGASLAESTKRSSPVRLVPAEKPYHLTATIVGTTCTPSASFTPRVAGDYEAVLHATNNARRLQIYRRATPGRPARLRSLSRALGPMPSSRNSAHRTAMRGSRMKNVLPAALALILVQVAPDTTA